MRSISFFALELALAGAAWCAPDSAVLRPAPAPLISALRGTMAGKPVIAVGLRGPAVAGGATNAPGDGTLLSQLQAIGEAASTEEIHLIPYAIGPAWVLAPETREEWRLPDSDASFLDTLDRRTALECFLASLSPDQIQQLASAGGLPAASLKGLPRAALAHILTGPLAIVESQPAAGGAPKDDATAPAWREVRRLSEPLDLDAVHILARLRVRHVSFRVGADNYTSIAVPDPPLQRTLRPGRAAETSDYASPLNYAPLTMVSNRPKRTDLLGRSFHQPIGVEGVRTVGEVVAAASRATGLKLHVIPMWKDVPAYIGLKDLPSGSVLDALPLALEGAWRRVGADYVLCWYREGLAPLQRLTIEALAPVDARAGRVMGAARRSRAWVEMARRLPFDETSPLALSDAQRSSVFPERSAQLARIGYQELDPSQQEWVQRQAQTHTWVEFSEGTGTYKRALSEEEIRTASVDTWFDVAVSVEEPSIGRLPLFPDVGRIDLDGQEDMRSGGLREAEKRYVETADSMLEADSVAETEPSGKDETSTADDAEPGKPEDADTGPAAIPSPVRAVMVPPLGAATLNDLAATMRRHGFNLLFYPALYDGYATMTGSMFALHPALRGKDGLQAATAAMAAAGIQVVPYLNTLTWHGEAPAPSLLRRHGEWLERDLLGRSRSDWLAAHPLRNEDGMLDVAVDRDFVRASEPAVQSRLLALLKEVSARPGLSGVALSDWFPMYLDDSGSSDGSPGPQPPMGFALADRQTFLHRTGIDPVDLTLGEQPPFLPRTIAAVPELKQWRIENQLWTDDQWYTRFADAPRPNVALVSSLFQAAKELRPEWKTYLFEYGDLFRTLCEYEKPVKPKDIGKTVSAPDHTIGVILLAGKNADGVSIPFASDEIARAFTAEAAAEMRSSMKALREGGWRMFFIDFHIPFVQEKAGEPEQWDPPAITVLNFQRMPAVMNEILRQFRAPTPGELAPPAGHSGRKAG